MSKDLEKLIKTLRKNGISYYKADDLELKLEPLPEKRPYARKDSKEEAKIKKEELDNITEDVLSDLMIADPLKYEALLSDLAARGDA
jgi:hypothetical protein